MNKKEVRHQLIRSLVMTQKIHTQSDLREQLKENGVEVTQATLSRDIKELGVVKVNGKESHYEIYNISQGRWEERLKFYMEDALILLMPVQNQIILKTLPGLAQSFGSILDSMQIPEILATVCGDDTCLIICKNNEMALRCFSILSKYTPPFFFSSK